MAYSIQEIGFVRVKSEAKTNSLKIATEHYYWKPGKALFHSFELEEYARAGIYFKHPIMDLGCGDGIFGAMLREIEVLDSIDFATDYSARGLLQVKRNAGSGCGVFQADARALPLKAGVLASVLANSAINVVRSDVDRAILEVYRVLADQGLFVLSVPTAWNDRSHLIPKIFRKVGASQLAIRYLAKLNRRLDHNQISDEEGWLKKLEDAHFHVEQVCYYYTSRQALWLSILTLQIFRVFAFLKILRVRWIGQKAARIQERIFHKRYL